MDDLRNEEKELTLEEMFDKLEGVIRNLESPEVNLEDSFTLYNEGMSLLKQCNTLIDTVEKKVLVLDEDGDTYEF